MFDELLQKLQAEHGIGAEQGSAVLNNVAVFIKEKFPMIGSTLDSLLHSGANVPSAGGTPPTAPTAAEAGGMMEQLEDFAKNKLTGLLGGQR